MDSASTDPAVARLVAGLARCETCFDVSVGSLVEPFVLLRPVREEGEIVDFLYEYSNDAARGTSTNGREALTGTRMLARLTQLAPIGLFDAYVTVMETGNPLELDDFAPPSRGCGASDQRRFDLRALKAGELLVLRWQDVTERDRHEAEHTVLDTIVRSSDDAIMSLDAAMRITTWNPGAEDIFGYSSQEILGQSSDVLIPSDATDESRGLRAQTAAGGEVQRYETQRRHADGTLIDVAITAFAQTDASGLPAGMTTITRDLTERAQATQALAESDERYREILDATPDITSARAQALKLSETVNFLALVTNSMAEGVCAMNGDGRVTYMNEAAETLLGWTKDDLAGCSVHKMIHHQHEDGSPYPAAECTLLGVLSTGQTLRVEDDTFTCRDGRLLPVSYSAAPITTDGEVAGVVVVFSDVSVRRAAEQHRDREREAITWVGRVRDALDEDRLVLYAQPIIDLHTREVVMHELLLRMIDRDGSIIEPGRFLPAAEQYDLIEDIDCWVVAQAINHAARGMKVHFNISGKTLGSRRLINGLVRGLGETGADPALLVCEITETALAEDQVGAEAFVHELSKLGCGIALDDFGTGYGGFTYLKRLPVSLIKIDIQFIRDMIDNPQNQHVVKAIVNLAQGFERQTVAEGVETHATLDLLEEYGVDYAQGFAIGRPAPINTAPDHAT